MPAHFQLMVWSAITYWHKLPLVFYRGNETVNSRSYSEKVIDNTVKPWLDEHDMEREWYKFMEDGAMPHWAIYTQNKKRESRVPALRRDEWPAFSPDLNPLDYFLWGYLKQKVITIFPAASFHQRKQKINLQVYDGEPCTNVHDLEARIRRAYEDLPQQMIQRAIDSLPARMELCSIAAGDPIVKWRM
jgi:hypothetical protein